MPDLGQLLATVKQYLDPHAIAAAGHTVLTLVIFAETGLAVGFFFPGDSLMVVAGLLASKGTLSLPVMLLLLSIAAIAGDAVGYFTGLKLGPVLFSRPKSLLFRPEHLRAAHAFYEKHGNKTIIMARFVPIVRTFAPIVAGAAEMPAGKFFTYNVVGGISWVFSMLLTGYFLGQFPVVEKNIEKVVILIVIISVLPMVFEYVKARRAKTAKAS